MNYDHRKESQYYSKEFPIMLLRETDGYCGNLAFIPIFFKTEEDLKAAKEYYDSPDAYFIRNEL